MSDFVSDLWSDLRSDLLPILCPILALERVRFCVRVTVGVRFSGMSRAKCADKKSDRKSDTFLGRIQRQIGPAFKKSDCSLHGRPDLGGKLLMTWCTPYRLNLARGVFDGFRGHPWSAGWARTYVGENDTVRVVDSCGLCQFVRCRGC